MFLFGNPIYIGSNFLQALGWAVINSLWQMAFLWVIFQVIISFGLHKPSHKSRLATVLLTAGFGWFFYTLISYWLIDPGAAPKSVLSLGTFDNGGTLWNKKLQQLLPYASIIYLLLLLLPAIQFIRNYRFVQVIRKAGLSKCNVDLRIFVQKFGERMGIRKPVHLYISELITSPVTIGFIKPIILMPIAAINSLTQKQVEAVLLHELSHIRRYDYFINLLINFVRTILYFNPFVKLFAKTIERERERSCDEMVMQFEYDPHGYASALLMLERNNYIKQTIAVAASGQRNDLLHRIEKILGIEKRKSPDFRKLAGLLAGLVCVVALNAFLFFSSPVIDKHDFAFTSISNPFYQLVSDGNASTMETPVQPKMKQVQAVVVTKKSGHQRKTTERSVERNAGRETHYVYSLPQTSDNFAQADLKMHLEQKLKKSEIAQVEGAVAAARKVLEEGQWKQVEKNVAEVLTETEKENLKAKYLDQVKKINWPKLEEKLRQSYDQINWNKVNARLNVAITNIKLDSLISVYNSTLEDLNTAQKWMTDNKVESIPDTDLKLGEIKCQVEQMEKQLQTVRDIKERKIIHL